MEELKTETKIIKEIKTANNFILKRLIESKEYIFGDPNIGLIFRVEFSNQPFNSDRTISFQIKDIEQAIGMCKSINTTDKEIEPNLRSIYFKAKIDDRRPLYLVCNFRRKDSI
jgi:hypothetical protein